MEEEKSAEINSGRNSAEEKNFGAGRLGASEFKFPCV
jgi:hypothetical protein